ncbi:hypothetical protein NE237_020816 [Protea cynaroides]|uniref:RNase H type-1 domain-containing protein n=1 Tax=Protea cynaroides TaxID=273540 RepID=A0A9Q0H6N6_9MAGN|nr:hypothetical protein NE237_020816 [Protea cynaroides]
MNVCIIWYLYVLLVSSLESSPVDVITRTQRAFREFTDVVLSLKSPAAQLLFPSVAIGEALSLQTRLLEAVNAGFFPLAVESDSLEVIIFSMDVLRMAMVI